MKKTEKSSVRNSKLSVRDSKTIVIVDDHPVIRQGLMQLIGQERGLEVCAECSDAQQAITAIRKKLPDAVIVDLSLRGISGLELVKNIKAQFPNLPILVLSMLDEGLYAERCLRAGAKV